MNFDGAVIKEQGVTFAVVVVNQATTQSTHDADEALSNFGRVFPGMPVVLMSQSSRGIPRFYGRKDIVNFLANVTINRIPWKRYSFN